VVADIISQSRNILAVEVEKGRITAKTEQAVCKTLSTVLAKNRKGIFEQLRKLADKNVRSVGALHGESINSPFAESLDQFISNTVRDLRSHVPLALLGSVLCEYQAAVLLEELVNVVKYVGSRG
jgi:hypothetical protein